MARTSSNDICPYGLQGALVQGGNSQYPSLPGAIKVRSGDPVDTWIIIPYGYLSGSSLSRGHTRKEMAGEGMGKDTLVRFHFEQGAGQNQNSNGGKY